jgi:hypothetical protein
MLIESTGKMRIHTFARENLISSRSVVHTLKLVGYPVKSASSMIEVTEDNRIFFTSVAAHCELIGG